MSSHSPQIQKIYHAALYLRLSKSDGDNPVSDSIINQKRILTNFVETQTDIEIAGYYEDDGRSGTTFDRPGFCRMLTDISKQKVSCIIVRDCSRFARNASESDRFLFSIFPKLGIRFISVIEGIDIGRKRSNSTDYLNISMHGMVNEFFVAQSSDKICSSLDMKRERGEFIGAFAKYGYKKDPADCHKLVIDEVAAENVRMIFRMYLNGSGIRSIARYLNEKGVLNPSAYKRSKGLNFKVRTIGSSPLWGDRTVRRILGDEMYTGTMLQGRFRKVSYKDKAIIALPQEEWIRVNNTHEAIISKEDFDRVQKLLHAGVKGSSSNGSIDLFAGLLKCADCGHALIKKINRNPNKTYVYYRCSTHCKCGSACSAHTLRFEKLYDAVLITIKTLISLAANADEVHKEIKNRNTLDKFASLQSLLKKQERELQGVLNLLADLYPDYKSGILNEDQYRINKENYELRQANLTHSIESLRSSIGGADPSTEADTFIERFRKQGNIDELTRPLLTMLIDRISVGKDGVLDIIFNFTDVFGDTQPLCTT